MKNIAIVVGLSILAVGFLRKSGQDAVKKGTKPEDTWAGKIGLL
jgi:hypothetical protein